VMVWDTGTFEFAIDDLRPIDDIALYPSDVLPDADINTQMVLLEAARIFDERNRGRADAALEPAAPLPGAVDRRRGVPLGGVPASGGGGAAGVASLPGGGGAAAGAAAHGAAQLAGLARVATGGDYPAGDSTHPALEPAVAVAEAPAILLLEPGREMPRRRWETPKHAAERLHLQIVSPDAEFGEQLGEALRHEVAGIVGVGVDQAGLTAPGEPPPIVIVDLRRGFVSLDQAAALRRARPRTSIIALVDAASPVAKVYAAGMLTALPADVEAMAACVENVIESREDLVRGSSGHGAASGPQSGVARLRRVFGDLRSGLISATVALNLMHIISESVERAVLFLVKRDHLVALGAFGADARGRPLAELTRGIKLPTQQADGVFSRSLALGEVQSVSFEDAGLPEPFGSLVGRSRTGQVVVFPVLGSQRVISVIYTDNGDRGEPIEDIDILELATAQVGMAFENELLRRQISQSRED